MPAPEPLASHSGTGDGTPNVQKVWHGGATRTPTSVHSRCAQRRSSELPLPGPLAQATFSTPGNSLPVCSSAGQESTVPYPLGQPFLGTAAIWAGEAGDGSSTHTPFPPQEAGTDVPLLVRGKDSVYQAWQNPLWKQPVTVASAPVMSSVLCGSRTAVERKTQLFS